MRKLPKTPKSNTDLGLNFQVVLAILCRATQRCLDVTLS